MLRLKHSPLYRAAGLSPGARRNLNLVILAAAMGSICMNIVTGTPLTGLAQQLGASDLIFSILMALPYMATLLQFAASALLERTRARKGMFLVAGVISRLAWLPAGLIPLLIPAAQAALRIWTVLALAALSAGAQAFMQVPFYSVFADLLPGKIRGQYIGVRNRVMTFSSMLAGLFIAWILDTLPAMTGYLIVFSLAALVGVADILSFIWVDFPPMEKPEKAVGFFKTARTAFKDKSFRSYLLFWTMWNFSIGLSSPFFNKYALGGLGLSFTTIILLGQIPCNALSIVFSPIWGRLADRFSSKTVLYFTTIITGAQVFFWLFATPGSPWVMFAFNFIGGIVWCGTDVCNQTMMITHTPQKSRSAYVALYNAVTLLIGTGLAFVCAGAFLDFVNPYFASHDLFLLGQRLDGYKVLFLITTVVRVGVPLIFLPNLCEKDCVPLFEAVGQLRRDLRPKKSAKSAS